MGTIIYRGSTPTIKFKPLNNVSVSDLGTPVIVIAQELVYLEPEVTINAAENYISAKLTEEETLSLVEGVNTSAQQIWKRENGNVIRYPVHALKVSETLMESVDEPAPPEPQTELENLHPFMVYHPFVDNGYFSSYIDGGENLSTQWADATTPWSQYLDDYMFEFDASEDSLFSDMTILPLTVSSITSDKDYYLWITSVGADTIAIDITVGGGFSFSTANGEETCTISVTNSDALVRLTTEESSANQPMFMLRMQTAEATGPNKIGMALYAIEDGVPEYEYKRYIPFEGGEL